MLLSPLGERLGEGLPAVTQHQRNLSPDPFRVLNDMVRPETQDTPAFALHRDGAAVAEQIILGRASAPARGRAT